jgi:hypothetical protein
MMDDDECGAFCRMLGKGSRSTRGKPAPVSLCPPNILHGLNPGSNPGCRVWNPATSRLSYSTAEYYVTAFTDPGSVNGCMNRIRFPAGERDLLYSAGSKPGVRPIRSPVQLGPGVISRDGLTKIPRSKADNSPPFRVGVRNYGVTTPLRIGQPLP